MQNIKIIFTDLDGTISTQKRKFNLTIDDKLALKEKQRDGIYTVITTGRPKVDINAIWNRMYLNEKADIVIYSNGAVIENFKTGDIYFKDSINEENFNKLMDFIEKQKKWYFRFSTEKHLYKLNPLNVFDKILIKRNKHPIKTIDIKKIEFNENINKVGIFASFSKKKNEIYLEMLQKEFPQFDIVTSGGGIYIEITNKNVNKGNAVKMLLEILEINSINALAFGDSMNDYSMFQVIENSVAMKNSHKEIKKIAKYKTNSVHKSGVSKFLKKNTLD